MKFVIRVDDLGILPDKTQDKGLSCAQRFHDTMRGLPYLGAVIPRFVDTDGSVWLKSKPEGLTVALHGWRHRKVDDVASEYRGMDLDRMRIYIQRGRDIFRSAGHEVVHTVPPFNAVEPDFADACYHEGIRYIWGAANHSTTTPSKWSVPPAPYPLGRVTFIPSWLPTYGATKWRMSAEDRPLNETLPHIKIREGIAVLTLHITWEASKSATFDGVRWLVDTIGDRVISVDEFLNL